MENQCSTWSMSGSWQSSAIASAKLKGSSSLGSSWEACSLLEAQNAVKGLYERAPVLFFQLPYLKGKDCVERVGRCHWNVLGPFVCQCYVF